MAKRNCKRISRRPREPIAGNAATMVSKIICSFLALFTILRTLSTRKILTMVAYIAISLSVMNVEMRRAAMEPTTTTKSKMFHVSRKYALRKAINLMTASSVKIAINT